MYNKKIKIKASVMVLFLIIQILGFTMVIPVITKQEPVSAASSTVIYYFDDYLSSDWNNPDNLVDGDDDRYSDSGEDGDEFALDENSYPGVGEGDDITKVEFRACGKQIDGAKVDLVPIFSSGNPGDTRTFLPDSVKSYSDWYDITNDKAAPRDWAWDDIALLNLEGTSDLSSGRKVELSIIEIRVTYTVEEEEPEPPTSFSADAYNYTQINLTWTKGINATHTYIEWNSTSTWTRGQGTEIYNNTGNNYNHGSLDSNTTYYYQAWSYNSTSGLWNDTYVSASNTTTTVESPTIIINFAGNLSDSGGPYWRPPGETIALSGDWLDGYYTNSSHQQEDWIYINCSITNATTVYLDWLNETTWTNGSYALSNPVGNYWEINTSGNITNIAEGYNYSFNINATGNGGNTIGEWNKTALGGNYRRRFIQLNCTTVNIEYTPFYFYNAAYSSGDQSKNDRLIRDQGPDGSTTDTGFFETRIPDNSVSLRSCTSFVGYKFNPNFCIESGTISNIYYHFWTTADEVDFHSVSFGKGRQAFPNDDSGGGNTWVQSEPEDRVTLSYDGDTYYLYTRKYDINTLNIDEDFTDNDIFEYHLRIVSEDALKTISNRSFSSFIVINLDNDFILDDMDTDNDGLNDYDELFVYYTNPFVNDTDNDGVTDWEEVQTGSDPNVYTNTTIYVAPPEPPTLFNAVKYNGTRIDLSWSNGINSTSTYIEYNQTMSWCEFDTAEGWTDPENSIDGDTETRAKTVTQDNYLYVNLTNPIYSNKIRVNSARVAKLDSEWNDSLVIDVYYENDWHNLHNGEIEKFTYVEFEIGDFKKISSVRIISLVAEIGNASHIYSVQYNGSMWERGNGTEIYNNTGESFSHTGLVANSLYYYQAWSYRATGNPIRWSGYVEGSNTTTEIGNPEDPTNFDVSAYNSTQINLTWTKGANATHTYIEWHNFFFDWDRGDGNFIYNDTGESYYHTSLDPNTMYYYIAWSYNNETNLWSTTGIGNADGTSQNETDPVTELTLPSVYPTSGVASYTNFYFNVTWKDTTYTPEDGYLKVNISKDGWYTNQSMSLYEGKHTISDSVIDNYTWGLSWNGNMHTKDCFYRLNSSNYFVSAGYGWLSTLEINDNGSIVNSIIDQWEFDATYGKFSGILHISDDIYLVYSQAESNSYLFTTRIWSTNGTLQKTMIDSETYTKAIKHDVIHVTDDIYALTYQEYSGDYDNFLETYEVTSTGEISSRIDYVEYDESSISGTGTCPMMCSVDSDTIAIVYNCNPSEDGNAITYNISDSGEITNTYADFWEYDVVESNDAFIKKISGTTYAIAYSDTSGDGQIKTLTISDEGAITESFIDTLEFDTGDCECPIIFTIEDGSVYGISYMNSNERFVCSINISSDGTIEDSILDSLSYDSTYNHYYAPICYLSDGYYVLCYSGDGGSKNGKLATINIAEGLVYQYSTTLTTGSYNYTFHANNSIRYNSSGPHSGPTVESQSLSFTITTSSDGDLFFKDWTLDLTGVGLTTQYNVTEDNQTGSLPALNITNTGNIPLNFSINWSSDPGSGIIMKWSSTNSSPNHGTNTVAEDPSSTQIITDLQQMSSEEIWLWMDFTNVQSHESSANIQIVSGT